MIRSQPVSPGYDDIRCAKLSICATRYLSQAHGNATMFSSIMGQGNNVFIEPLQWFESDALAV
ncbi:hypothetical protein MKX08_004525 [Trichoderma sp. CBMAI-0020]|nr:hypothetical protein MKX08_004525 [Trichoderma sp. CBMAI-0020]